VAAWWGVDGRQHLHYLRVVNRPLELDRLVCKYGVDECRITILLAYNLLEYSTDIGNSLVTSEHDFSRKKHACNLNFTIAKMQHKVMSCQKLEL
jgi:hypothetical protein